MRHRLHCAGTVARRGRGFRVAAPPASANHLKNQRCVGNLNVLQVHALVNVIRWRNAAVYHYRSSCALIGDRPRRPLLNIGDSAAVGQKIPGIEQRDSAGTVDCDGAFAALIKWASWCASR
jgi:hypothetical protein